MQNTAPSVPPVNVTKPVRDVDGTYRFTVTISGVTHRYETSPVGRALYDSSTGAMVRGLEEFGLNGDDRDDVARLFAVTVDPHVYRVFCDFCSSHGYRFTPVAAHEFLSHTAEYSSR